MSRPLLKPGGGSGDILSDVLHLRGVSEAETVISGAEGRDELRHIHMSLQAPEPCPLRIPSFVQALSGGGQTASA